MQAGGSGDSLLAHLLPLVQRRLGSSRRSLGCRGGSRCRSHRLLLSGGRGGGGGGQLVSLSLQCSDAAWGRARAAI